MTDKIEVPVEVIQSGDISAIRKLLPESKLFGRWATHIRLGRGIIYSCTETESGHVAFAHPVKMNMDGSEVLWVNINDLSIDPVVLTTEEDYDGAAEGTLISDYLAPNKKNPEVLWQKLEDGQWWKVGGVHYASMPGETRKVLRWGRGE